MATQRRIRAGSLELDIYETEAELPSGPNDRNTTVIVRDYEGNGPSLAFNNNGVWTSTGGAASGGTVGDLDVFLTDPETGDVLTVVESDFLTRVEALNPIAWWKLDETSGTEAVNSGSVGSSGVYTSMASLGNEGQIGLAAQFDRTTPSRILVDSLPGYNLTTGGRTYMAWVKFEGTPQFSEIIFGSDVSTSDNGNFLLGYLGSPNFKPRFTFYSGSGANHDWRTTADIDLADGQWHFIVATHTVGDGTTMKMYVDGVETPGTWETNNGNGTPVSGSIDLMMGARPVDFATPFGGLMQHCIILNYQIQASTVADLYNAPVTPTVQWENAERNCLDPRSVANLPTPTPGKMIYVFDDTGGPVPAFGDGTNFRRVTDRAIVTA